MAAPRELIFAKPVDGALFLFRKGFKVFPCKPNAKVPFDKGWQEWALSATEKKIEDFGRANPLFNWGVLCGASNLAVVDIDNKPKDGKDGFKTLKELIAKNGAIPSTLTIQSPSGGKHYYFRGEIKNSVSALGPGVDTRGTGGYVVAPGSRLGEESYRVIEAAEPQPVPAWVAKSLSEAKSAAKAIDASTPVLEGERNNTLTSLAGTMRRRGMGYDAILAALTVLNETQLERPLPQSEVETIAASVSRYAPEIAETASDFLTPVQHNAFRASQINAAAIPKRDWVMANRFIGGFISVVIAPGGLGKSTLTMLDGIAVACGKPLTGFEITRPGPVWIYNTEDPADELQRRLVAISMHHEIPLRSLENVHVTSGRDHPLILAKAGKDGVVVNKTAMDATIAYIKEHKIALLLVDPFVRTHECNENDNMQIDKVVWCFQRIADATGCAVGLVHHTSKQGSAAQAGEDGNMNAARGASALVYASRIAHTLSGMTEDEAKRFGVSPDERRWFMRLDNAKANLQPPAEAADWFKRISVTLMNGDDVGTLERTDLVDKRAERKMEANKGELSDFARCLSGIMVKGDKMSFKDAALKVFHHPAHAHLFIYDEASEKTKLRTIQRLMAEGPVAYHKKKFVLDFDPNRKVKNWIVCEEHVGGEVPADRVVDNFTLEEVRPPLSIKDVEAMQQPGASKLDDAEFLQ